MDVSVGPARRGPPSAEASARWALQGSTHPELVTTTAIVSWVRRLDSGPRPGWWESEMKLGTAHQGACDHDRDGRALGRDERLEVPGYRLIERLGGGAGEVWSAGGPGG